MSDEDPVVLTTSQAAAVAAAVNFWCKRHGVSMRDEDGRNALEAAIKLMRANPRGVFELLDALEATTQTRH